MLYLGNIPIAGLTKPLAARNVGEIVTSTLPLTDAGLHLLDGSLLQYGIYKDFIDYIAGLYTSNSSVNYFCTETEWQNSVTTYGSCGKFVYDSTLNTVRLPKVSDILQGTTDLNALGDLVEAGLPNITGEFFYRGGGHMTYVNGVFSQKKGQTSGQSHASGFKDNTQNIYFDASRSSFIYGNSTTVQPQTIKGFIYIVIATSTKTDIQVDIDEIATDLNGKADNDLTNVTDTGYIKMAGAGMPSSRYIDLTLGANGSTYTAPADGYYNITWLNSNLSSVQMYNDTAGNMMFSAPNLDAGSCFCPVKKGDRMVLYYVGSTARWFRFIYAQGSKSEAI